MLHAGHKPSPAGDWTTHGPKAAGPTRTLQTRERYCPTTKLMKRLKHDEYACVFGIFKAHQSAVISTGAVKGVVSIYTCISHNVVLKSIHVKFLYMFLYWYLFLCFSKYIHTGWCIYVSMPIYEYVCVFIFQAKALRKGMWCNLALHSF